MIRTTSFVQARPHRAGAISTVFWLLGLAGLAIGAYAIAEGDRFSQDAARLQGHLAAAPATQTEDTAIPAPDEIAALSRRIDYYNDLIGERSAAPSAILDGLEAALPAEVWVQTLSYDAETGRLALSLLSEEENLLPLALQRIEALDLLGAVILERQIRVRRGQRVLVQYDIRGTAS